MLPNSHFTHKCWHHNLCDVERRRDKSQRMLFGYTFHSALGSAKESAYLGKDFHHQQGGQKQLFSTPSLLSTHLFHSPSSTSAKRSTI